MILVTGPTGSGKTTSLYAIIQEVMSPELNVVTIEDPVEYELKGVAQVPVNDKQGLTFAEVLRSVLRQDPDVILVGEIRDRETAEIAFQAAQTGHLVLSTVHTNDSTATIVRLLELGVEPQVMGASLLAVVAQRLVRKVCPACVEPLEPSEEDRRALVLPPGKPISQGRGCAKCRDSGYKGRTGVYEVLRVSKAIAQLIEQKAAESALRAMAEDQGMTSLVDDARQKVLDGVTTPSEVLRVVEVENRGPSCPSCNHPIEPNFTVCPFCRNPLRLTCAGCGAVMKKKWTTCPFCGTDVSPLPGSARPLPEPARPTQVLGGFEMPKVLVVDDDADVLELVRLTLARSSPPLSIDVASSGADALDKIKTNRPHLVVLDLMMPGIDGFEVCKRLRADLATALIPVIMLTACSDAESKRLGFLSGTDDYVVKPFDRSELLARVHRLLQRVYGWNGPTGATTPPARGRAATA
jgi:type IV pilus assembly protein PilB